MTTMQIAFVMIAARKSPLELYLDSSAEVNGIRAWGAHDYGFVTGRKSLRRT
jgi:hypothetical protein